jgi:DNA polymerase-3 subunit gamma/tau|tara:strand:+ start:12580 stop:14208 length:1629 start_codon:yes stop_codon:yes gene_type:complete
MSYLALARKWRPKNFLDIVGQEHVVQALTNALESQRLHHAYLFSGTRGIGKTTIARILAKAFNCESGITSNPCGECDICREVDEGRFIDLIEVDAASKTKVDDTRELLDNVQFAATVGKFKVYLIDEVHMLSKHSFNALLKTLEEPPSHVKFFLATTDPQKLPVTVLSRCLQFNLKRISPKLILDRLCFICDAENIEYEKKGLANLARAADGSLRDALSLMDQAIAHCGGKLNDIDIATMLGTIDRKYIHQIMRSIADNDVSELLKTINAIDEFFPNYENLLGEIAEHLQQVAVIQVAGGVDESVLMSENMQEYASIISPEDVQLYYQIAIMGRRDIHLAPSLRAGCEMTLIRMLAFRPHNNEQKNIDSEIKKSSTIKNKTPITKPENQQKEQPKKVEILQKNKIAEPIKDTKEWTEGVIWSDLIKELNLSGLTKMLANNCALIGRKENTIHLILDEKSLSYKNQEREQILSKSLSDLFTEDLTVKVEISKVVSETPSQEKIRQKDEQLESARNNLKSDPDVKEAEDLFGVDMNPESITLKN